jgi:hypothetical protein
MSVDDGITADEKRIMLRDLKEAYYSGATRIRFRERDVIYRSLAEMAQAIDRLEGEISPSKRRGNRTSFASFKSGL